MFLKDFRKVLARCCHTKVNPEKNLSNEWKGVIGLEIHAQLSTKTKLFSCAPTLFNAPTNDAVSLFDAAIPGTLPSLNRKAVELAVTSALALGCKINAISYFDRKHYFYSDLPAGYQITQQRLPLAENGRVDYAIYQPGIHKVPYYKTSKIKQIQLEQDSGRSLHEKNEGKCFIDLNRAGIALIEIVFEPDVEDENEACALVKEVIRILERIGTCTCKMEEGTLRVDANVSIHKYGEKLGVRTEIKNLGSLNGVWNAIKYEINRQKEILDSGGSIKNQTLAWDKSLNATVPLRDKDNKHDYRFMPEPNLPPLRLLIDEYSESFHKGAKSRNFILNLHYLKEKIPMLPQNERKLMMEKYGLNDVNAFNLVNQPILSNYFKELMAENASRDPKLLYKFLMYQLLNALNECNIELENCEIQTTYLGEIVDLLWKRRISKMTADNLLRDLVSNKSLTSPLQVVEQNNLYIISSTKELRRLCLRILDKEQAAVALYKRKKRKSTFNDLVRKIIEESKFRADTQVLPRVLTDMLDEMENEK